MSENVYETNELENSVDNLEMLDYFLTEPMTGSRWKWAIIAAHQALYGFLICALKGTAPVLTVTEAKDREAWQLHFDGHSVNSIATTLGESERQAKERLANPKLIKIHEALKRMKKKERMPWAYCVPLKTSPDEDEAIKTLIYEFRNNFEHFVPKLWVIGTANFPAMFIHVMRVIRFIALESNAIFDPNHEYTSRIEQSLQSINNKLDQK